MVIATAVGGTKSSAVDHNSEASGLTPMLFQCEVRGSSNQVHNAVGGAFIFSAQPRAHRSGTRAYVVGRQGALQRCPLHTVNRARAA